MGLLPTFKEGQFLGLTNWDRGRIIAGAGDLSFFFAPFNPHADGLTHWLALSWWVQYDQTF
ncbi:MAG: hypothetical protein NVS2B7_36810 [Herpetosiphon sp.]